LTELRTFVLSRASSFVIMTMTIYFVAGEASADNHGAALMGALGSLNSNLRFIGRGGPRMKAVAGDQFKNWIDESGVLGLWEVIKRYPYFRKQFRATLREIEENNPDAVVLIDYPGFNLRLARALHRNTGFQPVRLAGVSPADSAQKAIRAGRADPRALPPTAPKLIYYISPQVWAWNRSRIKKMAQWIDLMLCIFPFEADLYNRAGLRAVFVGHPMIERLRGHKIEIERDPNLVGLFPGSRSREVRKIFPILIETANELVRQKPDLRFEVAAASLRLAQEMENILARVAATNGNFHKQADGTIRPLPSIRGEAGIKQSRPTVRAGAPVYSAPRGEAAGRSSQAPARELLKIKIDETAGIMQRAFVGIVASGSATLEAAYYRLPFVLIYKVSWLTYLAARLVVRVKHLGMPNVLANREIVAEFIQHHAKPHELAKAVSRLIDEPARREKMITEFDTVINSLGQGGASERAAQAILAEIA
jgi:lipid-A-disaccharide synthase